MCVTRVITDKCKSSTSDITAMLVTGIAVQDRGMQQDTRMAEFVIARSKILFHGNFV